MKFARSALVVVVASLGVAGGVAGGCGGDDDGGTTGTAGAGKGGTGGSGSTTSTTSTGGAGTTGGGGSGGAGSGGTGGMIDAGPSDADISACLMPESGVGTGSMCLDTCFCTTCPRQAQKCYNNADCVAIIQCAARTGCKDAVECSKPETCGGVLAEHGTGLADAIAFGPCGAGCTAKCAPPEGGTPDASEAAADTGGGG